MEVYRELTITLKDTDVEAFISALEEQIKGEECLWKRDTVREKDFTDTGRQYLFCFDFRGKEGLHETILYLGLDKSEREFRVSNIGSMYTTLNYPEYNRVIEDFVETILKPVSLALNIKYEISPDNVSAEDLFGAEAAELLKQFASFANKSTGSTHPADQKRWFDFIIAAHKAQRGIDPRVLYRLLREEYAWSDKLASELLIEYEQALALLRTYDRQ